MSLLACGLGSEALAQSFTENFDDITLLAGNGWLIQNNSVPVGSLNWFQGTATTASPTPGPFNAYNGAVNAYIAANFNSTGSTGTISNWLVMPNRTLRNGDVLTFYTRKPTIGSGQTDFPDRLEVRLSTNGASSNVGTGATAVGDFTTLMLSINPSLVTNVYPQTWTQYTVTVSGLPAPTSGRMAFRYYVTGAGSLGANSDYIGIDNVVYTPYACPTLQLTPASLTGGVYQQAYSQSLTQTGALGTPSYAVTAGALPPGLTLSGTGTISGSPTSTGNFNFTATVNDNSGCSGSRAYALTVNAGVPGSPLNPSATAGNGEAVISWQAPASDGGAAINGYQVTAVEDASKTCTPAAGALSCTVSGLTNGVAYTFRVVASNSAGASLAATSNAVTPQGTQSIVFANPGAQTVGVPLTLSASASSGLPVGFAASGDCSLSGATLNFTAPGSCTVTATQAGNAAWQSAAAVSQTFAVAAPAIVNPVPALGQESLAGLLASMASLTWLRRRRTSSKPSAHA